MAETLIKVNEFLDFIFAYGPFWVYALIFLACFIENIFPPFPGDSFIVGAGALSAMGRLDFALSFIIVIAGGMCSVMILYFIGNRFGRDYFIRKDFKYLSKADIIKAEDNFKKYGVLLLILSRFVVGFRVLIALTAGISKYQFLKMILFSTISYMLFAGVLMYASNKLVENLDVLQSYFKTYNMIIWPLLIIALSLFIIWKIRKVKGSR